MVWLVAGAIASVSGSDVDAFDRRSDFARSTPSDAPPPARRGDDGGILTEMEFWWSGARSEFWSASSDGFEEAPAECVSAAAAAEDGLRARGIWKLDASQESGRAAAAEAAELRSRTLDSAGAAGAGAPAAGADDEAEGSEIGAAPLSGRPC